MKVIAVTFLALLILLGCDNSPSHAQTPATFDSTRELMIVGQDGQSHRIRIELAL